jgi:phosphoribosyl 1,2-cyclic phosphodiesterase
MRVHLCGVRGSCPSPGAEFTRTGGHTSCVAVAHDGEPPSLVLDAGTGLRALSALLAGAPFRGTLLLSHLHWDHTHGLPFFPAGDRDDAEVSVLAPAQGVPTLELLSRPMAPPNFPITPLDLRGRWTFGEIDEGDHEIGGFAVRAREIPHKGGRTFGYRVASEGGAFAYLSDHAPHDLGPGADGLGEHHAAARDLCAGVDVLVHDAQYTAAELPARRHFGHAALEYPIGLARALGIPRVLLFHHDPSRTDDQLDAIVQRVAGAAGDGGPVVEVAREGVAVDLGAVATARAHRHRTG